MFSNMAAIFISQLSVHGFLLLLFSLLELIYKRAFSEIVLDFLYAAQNAAVCKVAFNESQHVGNQLRLLSAPFVPIGRVSFIYIGEHEARKKGKTQT